MLILGHDKNNGSGTNFPMYLPGLNKVFPDRSLNEFTRREYPKRFEEEISTKLPLLPDAKRYSALLYR